MIYNLKTKKKGSSDDILISIIPYLKRAAFYIFIKTTLALN